MTTPRHTPTGQDPVRDKDLYETLDSLSPIASRRDELANLLTDLLGLQLQIDRKHPQGQWVRNPDRQAAADRTARRWLRDNGYMEH